MVYITGDMHGELKRFSDRKLKRLSEEDVLMICGDFGFIWNGSEQEKKFLEEIGEKPYNVCRRNAREFRAFREISD